MRLKDKVAIVTGGASGFGAGIVTCFASVGAKVLIADRDLNKAEELANRISAHGSESHGPAQVDAIACDVTDYAQVEACVDRAKELYGGLDIMVANAGLGQRPCRLEETSEEVYDQQFDVNMRGVFYCSKAVLPGFRAQGSGSIIITASGIALMPRPNLVIYGATKGAVLTFAKGLAMEVASEGIRVNALCPAAGDTPMLVEVMGGQASAEAKDKFRESLPIGRFITPEDMGWAAVYLASDSEAGAITGTALAVDGGRTT
jgi:3-oxoacyl-[acyl-carrier protein] reductase